MMKNRINGFTLIELLGVIVIIAIIAVITVPIVSDLLSDSKKEAAKNSAYGYVDSVNRLYYSNSLNNSDDIDDGIYSVSELKNMGVSISGKEPSDGWVEMFDSEVVSYSLRFGNYVVTKYADRDVIVLKSVVVGLAPDVFFSNEIIQSLTGTVKSDGAKYLTTPVEIYYNPLTGKVCNGDTDSDKYVSTNSDTGVASGCMKWYLYAVKGNYANMLLDHNMTEKDSSDAVWCGRNDYYRGLTDVKDSSNNWIGMDIVEGEDSMAVSAGVTYPDSVEMFPLYNTSDYSFNNSRGPLTVLNYLKDLTKNWQSGVPMVPNSESTREYIVSFDKNDGKYQIDYSGYRARLITKEELEYFGCKVDSSQCPTWVKGNLYSSLVRPWGYWTSSPLGIGSAYIADADGWLNTSGIGYDGNGIRPVITVPIVSVLSLPED